MLNQLRYLVLTAPEPIRIRFKDRYKAGLVNEAASLPWHRLHLRDCPTFALEPAPQTRDRP
jgi:hypothetical protein